MIILHKISREDTEVFSRQTKMSASDLEAMITDSDSGRSHGRYFEAYTVTEGGRIVGWISLYEHSASVVSLGPEIFGEYRRHGYATKAMQTALGLARMKGYRIVCQQVRTDNSASIGLHTKLGFETDQLIFKNRNQNDVFLYLKPI